MEGQDLSHGNIRKELWSLAWPMMLSVFFYTLYNIVDAYWVSKLSDEAIAAVSISQITLFAMISLGFGLIVGSGVIMSMHIGAKNHDEAERVLGQSFVLSAGMAVFFTIVALIFRTELLTLSGANGDIFAPAMDYYTITSAGSILMFLLMTIMFAFNAQGDTNTLTKLFAVSTFINLIVDPLLIFGHFGFPELGISGAAFATLISQAVFIVIAIRSLSSEKRKIRFKFKNLTFKWESVKKVLNIGLPASFTQIIFPVGLAILTYMVSQSFQEPGAIAFSLGFRIEFFAYLPAVGFGFASMAMIGQSIGAGNIKRAQTAFKIALKYGFFAATGLGVAAAIFAVPLIKVFTTDPLVTEYAKFFMWTVALSYGFLAALMIEANSFQAIGRSWPGFWIFLTRIFVVSVPLTYLSTNVLELPILGVWCSIIAGNVIAASIGFFWISKTMKGLNDKDIPVHHGDKA